MKKTYIVSIKEIHYSNRIVEAESEEDAKMFAADADEQELEYSHTCPEEEWIIKETDQTPVDENGVPYRMSSRFRMPR